MANELAFATGDGERVFAILRLHVHRRKGAIAGLRLRLGGSSRLRRRCSAMFRLGHWGRFRGGGSRVLVSLDPMVRTGREEEFQGRVC